MTKRIHTARCAPVAIAAMLALGPTCLMAQETAGTILPVPAETATPAATPESILPMQSPVAPATTTMRQPVIVSEPQVQSVPDPDPPAAPGEMGADRESAAAGLGANADPAPAASSQAATVGPAITRTTPEPGTAPRIAGRANATAPSETAAPGANLENAELVPVAPVASIPPADNSMAANTVTNGNNGIDPLLIAALLAGIIPIGLALGATSYLRHRSRKLSPGERRALEPLAAQARRAPNGVVTSPISPVDAPASAPPVIKDSDARIGELDEPIDLRNAGFVEPVPVAPPHPGRSELAAGGVAVKERPVVARAPESEPAIELPQVVPTGAEREYLLDRMASAEPDRANPFRSYKARRKRARLILQSLERKFENTKPGIDLSQYSRTWPALAGRRPHTA